MDAKKEMKREGVEERGKGVEETWDAQKALALQEERIKLDKDKFDFERDREEERIINVDMSTMSTRQQQFYDDQNRKYLQDGLEISSIMIFNF